MLWQVLRNSLSCLVGSPNDTSQPQVAHLLTASTTLPQTERSTGTSFEVVTCQHKSVEGSVLVSLCACRPRSPMAGPHVPSPRNTVPLAPCLSPGQENTTSQAQGKGFQPGPGWGWQSAASGEQSNLWLVCHQLLPGATPPAWPLLLCAWLCTTRGRGTHGNSSLGL